MDRRAAPSPCLARAKLRGLCPRGPLHPYPDRQSGRDIVGGRRGSALQGRKAGRPSRRAGAGSVREPPLADRRAGGRHAWRHPGRAARAVIGVAKPVGLPPFLSRRRRLDMAIYQEPARPSGCLAGERRSPASTHLSARSLANFAHEPLPRPCLPPQAPNGTLPSTCRSCRWTAGADGRIAVYPGRLP